MNASYSWLFGVVCGALFVLCLWWSQINRSSDHWEDEAEKFRDTHINALWTTIDRLRNERDDARKTKAEAA